MQKAIEVLMEEHRLIEQVLGSLETYALLVRAGAAAEREVAGEFASFFSGFADACHHGKEEDLLFRRLLERGFSRQAGPLAVMYYEHELGRAQVAGLREIAQGTRAPGLLLEHADEYVPLLRQHILKEDQILYPMALRVLAAAELDALNSEFEVFAARVRADGSEDRLRRLADDLTARFRPDPARMAAAGLVAHCG